MKPFEVMRCSIPEILAFIDGYYRRLRHSWEQSRILAYSIYAVVTDENRRDSIEDWMPLWFDPSPEERAAAGKIERAKQGMVAEKEIEHYRSLGIDL
jgi:hypothetical protein